MYDHIVFDVEIQKTIPQCSRGWESLEEMGVSVACVWEYRTARMRIYGSDDVPALQERILRADRVSGFNIHRFDYPVVWGYSREEWELRGEDEQRKQEIIALQVRLFPKTNDLLRRIWQAQDLDPDVFMLVTHGGWGLDAVSRATLGAPGKIGYGGDAPLWYQAGQWAKLTNYCADDVALERDLVNFVDRYGYVSNGKTVVWLKNAA